MPTYDYECGKCGHTFDAFQSMSDEPLKKCPSCSQKSLRRLIGGGLGVIFKGSGFYSTDSRSGSKATSVSTAKTSESGGSDSAAPGTTTTPDSGAKSDSSGRKEAGTGKTPKGEKVAG